jgi:hypothetical protein
MRNAEAQVCQAAGPRWEARSGAGGQALGEVCPFGGEIVGGESSMQAAWFDRQ